MVMFVFREEYYREREKPGDHDIEGMMKWKDAMSALHGKAEVIIGKQRHGPIGTRRSRLRGRVHPLLQPGPALPAGRRIRLRLGEASASSRLYPR